MSRYSEDVVLGVALVEGSLQRQEGLDANDFGDVSRRALFIAIRDIIGAGNGSREDLLVHVYRLICERGQSRLFADLKAQTGLAFELGMIVGTVTLLDIRNCRNHVEWIISEARGRHA